METAEYIVFIGQAVRNAMKDTASKAFKLNDLKSYLVQIKDDMKKVNKLELARGVEDDDRIDLMAFDDLPMPNEYSDNYQYHVTTTFPGGRNAGPNASQKSTKGHITDKSVCVTQ